MEQCGGTAEKSWWNTVVEECNNTVKTVMVEQCGGTFEQSWWNRVVKKWTSHCGTVWWNSGTVWWKSGTVMVVQWNSNRGTVEQ